ncbi:hypothetical protein REPUB_Repub03eG0124400 [Reevesia pubescens]
MDWNSICNLKEFGGLGLVDLMLKNKALLNKCVWRYGKEKDWYWKKVIDCKYEGDESSLFPILGNNKHHSFIWKNITKVLSSIDAFGVTLSANIGVLLRDEFVLAFERKSGLKEWF